MKRSLYGPILATGLVVSLIGACSSPGTSQPGDTGTTPADTGTASSGIELTTQVPAPTGEVEQIRWNSGYGEPETLDPAKSALEKISTIVGNLCEPITRFEPDSEKPVPNLAEKVTQPDERTFVLDLRSDATFWNGNPVTAEDVRFSFERVMNPDTASSWASAYQNLESLEVTGENQVTVTFADANPMFEWFLATPAATIVEKAFVEEAGAGFGSLDDGVMCSGPYKLDSWQGGQEIRISAYDGYWDTDRQPLVKQITFTFTTEASAMTASLLTGGVDGQWNVPASGFDQLAASDAGELMFGESLSPVFISGFASGPAMQVPELRQALSLVVDREQIGKAVYAEAAAPIKTLTPPATWGYSRSIFEQGWEDLPDRVYDVDAARELVEAIEGDVPPITLAYNADQEQLAQIAAAIESAGRQAGMDIQLRAMPPAEYFLIFSDPAAREGLDGYLVRGYLDFPEPLSYNMYRTAGHFYNYGGYDNPAFDELIFKAAATMDDDERARLVVAAEKILAEDSLQTPIVSPYLNLFVSSKLTGLVPWPGFLYTSWATHLGAAE